jgi:hypothetical protein
MGQDAPHKPRIERSLLLVQAFGIHIDSTLVARPPERTPDGPWSSIGNHGSLVISPSQYSQEMDPQAASTLAQVIPVIALALGLEMRARASRVRGMKVVGYAPQWIGVIAMVTASSLVLFECVALTALFQLNKTESVGGGDNSLCRHSGGLPAPCHGLDVRGIPASGQA